MRSLLNGYYRLLQVVLTVLITVLIVPVAMQILSRYTGLIPRYIWTEEIARFCFVWIILIGAMIAVRDGTHFSVDLLPLDRTPLLDLVSKTIVNAAILAMAVAFLVWGYDFGVLGARQRSEIAGIPMLSIYVAWPIAGATWAVFVAERLWDDFHAYRAGAPGQGERDGAG